MKKVDVTVHGPNNSWSFAVTEDRYGLFMSELYAGRMARLTKTSYGGHVTEYTFNPAMIVAVTVSEGNSPF